MRKLLFAIIFCAGFAVSAFAQGSPPITVTEVDGSPRVNGVTKIVVSNGTLTVSGKTATITTGGGGAGCTPPGTASRVLYDDGAGGCTSTSGLTATSSTVTIVSGVTATFSRAGVLYTGTVTTDNASVQTMLLQGDRATPTANDEAYISFQLSDDGGGQTEVARQTWAIPTVTAGAENGRLDWAVITGGVLSDELQLSGADLSPSSSDGLALGTASLQWSDLFLASGGVIDFANGNVVLTHSSGVLTMGTGELRITTVGTNAASVPTLGSSSILSNKTLATGTAFAGYSDIATIVAPANPSAGSIRLFADSGTGNLTCLTSAGGNCLPSGSSGITIGTTTITGGTSTDALYNNGGVLGSRTVTGSGNAVLSASPTLTGTVAMAAQTNSGTIVQTSNSATAFESGPNGGTNPVFRLVNSTASQATGLSITGNAAGSHVTLSALSSAASESILLAPKGATGTLRITTSLGTSVFQDASYALSLPGAIRDTSTFFVGSGGGFTGLLLGNALQLKWSSTTNWFDTSDLFLRRSAAATLAYGVADANPPVAQSQIVQSATGTNISGATWTRQASLGTSQGVPGRHSLTAGAMIASSGTTQQTAVSRLELGATKVLTNNSAITIVNVTDAAGTSMGGVLDYCVEVTDGTDTQYECGMATYGISNKAGAFSGNTVTKFGNQQNATSGTLTVTFAISAANPGALSVNANSSLTPSTGYPRVVYSLRNLGNQAVSVQ